MKRFLFLTLLFIFGLLSTNAQAETKAIGLRLGNANGLTLKSYRSHRSAIEGIFTTRWGGINATGLFELNHEIASVPGLVWFYGAGAHAGVWSGSNVRWATHHTVIVIGVDGIVGLEYSFSDAPFNISLDWKPAFNLVGYFGIWPDGAISFRYIF